MHTVALSTHRKVHWGMSNCMVERGLSLLVTVTQLGVPLFTHVPDYLRDIKHTPDKVVTGAVYYYDQISN